MSDDKNKLPYMVLNTNHVKVLYIVSFLITENLNHTELNIISKFKTANYIRFDSLFLTNEFRKS